MKAIFKPSILNGEVIAPASKSLSHRLLICAALSKKTCTITNILFSEDILATLDCLRCLGAIITIDKDSVTINGSSFLEVIEPVLNCNESGSTLRFFIPLAFLLDKTITFKGSKRLLERPLSVYEEIARENNFRFEKHEDYLIVKGKLQNNHYRVKGDISSQFITGLLFALSMIDDQTSIEIIPPIESKSYITLTTQAFQYFGVNVEFKDNVIKMNHPKFNAYNGAVEADESNAAFLDAFNYIDSNVVVKGLNPNTLQGDAIYHHLFPLFKNSCPDIDIQDCPDLGPVLMALGALNNGVHLFNTRRLKAKECDRANAMKEELSLFGIETIVYENELFVKQSNLHSQIKCNDSHNDHRIVMAISLILSKIGGEIEGVESVKKSFPTYFDTIKKLNCKVEIL